MEHNFVTNNIKIEGKVYDAVVKIFDNVESVNKVIKLYKMWTELNTNLKDCGYRGLNIHEGITESLVCIVTGSYLVKSIKGKTSSSFDCYNPKTEKRIQVKATSVKHDCTSFGPKSVYDTILFVNFSEHPKYDIYEIPKEIIDNQKMNATQTFVDQQNEGRRPRFSICNMVIDKDGLQPIFTGNILELTKTYNDLYNKEQCIKEDKEYIVAMLCAKYSNKVDIKNASKKYKVDEEKLRDMTDSFMKMFNGENIKVSKNEKIMFDKYKCKKRKELKEQL